MTLNSVAIAITSAPSVADIGLSGIPIAASTSADHPVASTIGISGTSARLGERHNWNPERDVRGVGRSPTGAAGKHRLREVGRDRTQHRVHLALRQITIVLEQVRECYRGAQ